MKQQQNYSHYLDVIGLHCPQPVIGCKAALTGLSKGEILTLAASDSSSLNEIPLLLESLGDELIAVHQVAGHYRYTIRRMSTTRNGRPTLPGLLQSTLAVLVQLVNTGKPLEASA